MSLNFRQNQRVLDAIIIRFPALGPRVEFGLNSATRLECGFCYLCGDKADTSVSEVTIPERGAEALASPLSGSSDALALARLASEARPVAVLCAQAADAQRLCEEMAWFAPSLK